MRRCILNVATGPFVSGQYRLMEGLRQFSPGADFIGWQEMPANCPDHRVMPYAFKAHAIWHALTLGYDLILWADASIVPIAPLEPLWQRIEKEGYWMGANGFKNSEWTNIAALPLLGVTAEENDQIQHVVAGCFGLNLKSRIGCEFAHDYREMAANGSFLGPWTGGIGVQHRHDQTCASVIAHRLGFKLTNPPDVFCYDGAQTAETILVARGI